MTDCYILHVDFLIVPQSRRVVFHSMEEAIAGAGDIIGASDVFFEAPDWSPILRSGEQVFGFGSAGLMVAKMRLRIEVAEIEDATPPDEAADPVYFYILMRNDCPGLNPGKAVAQGSHAANAMVHEGRAKQSPALDDLVVEWENETKQGFGTCVTLTCDAADMEQTVALATLKGIHANIIHDPTYPLRDGTRMHFLPVNTCAYLFGRKSSIQPLVRKFRWMD